MLQIRMQGTPNPNARKYALSEEIKAEGKVTYQSAEECEHIPLAYALMISKEIKQVHLFENILTVTKNPQEDWKNIDQIVQDILDNHILNHDIFFQDFIAEDREKKPLTPELQEIDNIISETIRPSLQMDGGDIELIELEKNILTISYMGACGDCPSSMTGTLDALQSILQDRYNENIQVAVV